MALKMLLVKTLLKLENILSRQTFHTIMKLVSAVPVELGLPDHEYDCW